MVKPLNRFFLSWDQVIAIFLTPVIILLLAFLYIVVVPLQGRPFIYKSERMRSTHEAFDLYKIRTLYSSDAPHEQSALGGNLRHRVTPIGAFLRRTRLDEFPQIFNVLRGDIKFIGPRPPLRSHVEAYPVGFATVFAHSAPGITGLATVLLHAREERLLARCRNCEETDEVFFHNCLPIKLRIDTIYMRNKCISLDLYIIWKTVSRLRIKVNAEERITPMAEGGMQELPEFYKYAA